jgi:hypothetical protein
MARHIALINVLDSMPLAIDLTVREDGERGLDDLEALRQAVAAQLRAGVSDAWFRRVLEGMSIEVAEDNLQLQQLDELFRNEPGLVIGMTHYAPGDGGGPGQIWQAMMALDDINQATMQNLRTTAQLNALAGGLADLRGDDVYEANALAVVADIPWERGTFSDFEQPVRRGLLPDRVDDKQYNRGPFDVLFGWRGTDGTSGGAGSIPGPGAPPLTGPPRPPVAATTYRTYGTQAWMINQVPSKPYERLRYWTAQLANIKRSYIWPGGPLQTVIDPMWEIDIQRDRERADESSGRFAWDYADNDRSDIKETLYVVAEIKSRVRNNAGSPGTQGVTWDYIRRPGVATPFLMFRSGWHDARQGPPMNVQSAGPTSWRKVNDHIWRLSASYMTNPDDGTLGGDPEIGLPPRRTGTDPDGNPVYAAQEVFWEIDFMLVGVNVGPEVEVRDPYIGFDAQAADAPAPMDFNHDLLGYDQLAGRRQYLSVLAIAQQADQGLFWPSRFDEGKPYPYTVAIAQAKVFNNHSWDLWTQMWHAQLEPVSDYPQWLGALENFPADSYPTQGDAEQMHRYLASLEDLAELLLTH